MMRPAFCEAARCIAFATAVSAFAGCRIEEAPDVGVGGEMNQHDVIFFPPDETLIEARTRAQQVAELRDAADEAKR